MLVKFEEEEKKKTPTAQPQVLDIDQLSIQAGKMEAEVDKEKYTPTTEDLQKLLEEVKTPSEWPISARVNLASLLENILERYHFNHSSKHIQTLQDNIQNSVKTE